MGHDHDGRSRHAPEPMAGPPVGIVTPGVATPHPGDSTIDLQGGVVLAPSSPVAPTETATATVGTFADDGSHLSGAASVSAGTGGGSATHQISVTGETDHTTALGATSTQTVAVTPGGTTVGGTLGGEVDFGGTDVAHPAASVVVSGGAAASLGTVVPTAGGPVDAGTAPVVTASAAVLANPAGYGDHDNPQVTVGAEAAFRGTYGTGTDGSPVRDESITGTVSVGGNVSLDPHDVVRLGASASVTHDTVTAGGRTDSSTGVTFMAGVSGSFGGSSAPTPTSDRAYHVTTGDRAATISGGHDYAGRVTEFDREHDRLQLGNPPRATVMRISEIQAGSTQTPDQVEARLRPGSDARIEIDRDGSCYVAPPRERGHALDRGYAAGR